jgi:hypothetical protein
LRLATKYLIDQLRKYARDTISCGFPATLEQWDAYKGGRTWPEYIIVLARETETHILLPAAFYFLCNTPSGAILDSPLNSLSDICAYHIGKEQLSIVWQEFIKEEWSSTTATNCADRECNEDWNKLAEEEQWNALHANRIVEPDPLDDLKRYSQVLDEREQLCHTEVKAANMRANSKRRELWDSLPKIFGLGTWDELKKDL